MAWHLHDPYEIAYLRGAEREAFRLKLFEFFLRGDLAVREDPAAEVSPEGPWLLWSGAVHPAGSLEILIRSWFARVKDAEMSLHFHFHPEVEATFSSARMRLEEARLLVRLPHWINRRVRSLPVGIASLLAPCGSFAPRTRAGEACLNELRGRYERLGPLGDDAELRRSNRAAMMAVAVFGVGVLRQTRYDAFARALDRHWRQRPWSRFHL